MALILSLCAQLSPDPETVLWEFLEHVFVREM
jgi:hypothetical protein